MKRLQRLRLWKCRVGFLPPPALSLPEPPSNLREISSIIGAATWQSQRRCIARQGCAPIGCTHSLRGVQTYRRSSMRIALASPCIASTLHEGLDKIKRLLAEKE